jgi:hypothetical protein
MSIGDLSTGGNLFWLNAEKKDAVNNTIMGIYFMFKILCAKLMI